MLTAANRVFPAMRTVTALTAADALLVMRCALGTAELSPETAALCDADGDGNVTLSDAVLILRAALGLG